MLLALLLVQDTTNIDAAIANHRAKTRADVACRATSADEEIMVCALRDADRYRVPLVPAYSGKNLPDAEVARLIGQRIEPECGQGAFMARCGAVGVGVTFSASGKAPLVKRGLAP